MRFVGTARKAKERVTKFADVRQADRQVNSGHYIKHEDMKVWLLSRRTEHELPLPRCVCGRAHDDMGLYR
ncbi:MAG: hypothetical protein LAO06_14060 [Acidobacteriia bacterium]|nr:hypothetical protein [Terriglobia bacterium]